MRGVFMKSMIAKILKSRRLVNNAKKYSIAGVLLFILGFYQNCSQYQANKPGMNSDLSVSAQVSISGPAEQFATQSAVMLTGSCASGMQVLIEGDVSTPLNTACTQGQFSASVTLSNGDGNKTVIVKQTDSSGRELASSRTFVRDTVAPAVSLIQPASGLAVGGSVSVQGLCEAGLPVRVQEGSSVSMQNCVAGALSYSHNLSSADGSVNLILSQTDAAGNTASITLALIKDTIAPAVTIVQPAAGATVTGSAVVSGACESGTDVEVTGAGVSAPVSVPCTGNAYSTAAVFTAGAGAKVIQVNQRDAAGNIGSASRSVTRQADLAPAVAITQPAANTYFQNTLTVSGTCQSGLPVVFSGTGWMSPANTTCTSGTFSAVITFTAGDGSKNLIVSQTSSAGLTGSASRTFVRDTTAPALTIASPAANSAYKSTVTLMGACEAGLNVQIAGSGVAAASSATCTSGAYSASVTLSNGDGSKTVQLSQTDAAGNATTVSRAFVKDTVAPVIAINQPAADTVGATGLTISGTCEGTLNISATGSGLASSMSKACAGGTFSMDIIFSAGDGTKAVQVSQTDAAGNTGSSSRNFKRETVVILDGVALYTQNCASCHGPIATSSKIGRNLSQVNNAIANVSSMAGLSFLTTAQRQAIVDALAPAGGVNSPFACTSPDDLGSSVIQRLSKTQYVNTLGDLFGSSVMSNARVSDALSTLPDDNVGDDSKVLSNVTNDQVEGYLSVGMAIGDTVNASDSLVTTVFTSCALAASPAATCIDSYLNNFAPKIFRRPLTSAELTEARAIANAGGNYRTNIKRLLVTHLSSPAFLIRLEVGTANDDSAKFALTPYEIATRISYAITDSMPDATLTTAAKNNALSTAAQIETQVRRLASTERGRQKVRGLFKRWLQQPERVDFSNLPADLIAGVQINGLGQAMADEMDMFLDYMIWERNAGYKELLTSKASFASNSTLASIYQHAPANPNRTPGSATAMMGGRRQGILMRSALMASTKGRTGMIARGVKFRRRVLCEELPSPTADIVEARENRELSEAEVLMMSNRKHIEHLTNTPVCMTCHSKINPTGAAFENLDPFGGLRTSEAIFDSSGKFLRSVAVDTAASVPTTSGGSLSVTDGFDLTTHVAESVEGPACFAKNAFRYTHQRMESPNDACELDAMYKHLTKADASILDAYVASVASQVSGLRKK